MGAGAKNYERIVEIKKQMLRGELSYVDACQKLQDVLDDINEQSKVVAKKYGRRPTKLTAAYVLRATDV